MLQLEGLICLYVWIAYTRLRQNGPALGVNWLSDLQSFLRLGKVRTLCLVVLLLMQRMTLLIINRRTWLMSDRYV